MKKILLFILLLVAAFANESTAQKAKLYDYYLKTLKGTYSSLQEALEASMPQDSISLSADKFEISNFYFGTHPVIIQGTIKGTDTTILDAKGGYYFFKLFNGVIGNIVFTGLDSNGKSDPFGIINSADYLFGPKSGISSFLHFRGNITFRDNNFYMPRIIVIPSYLASYKDSTSIFGLKPGIHNCNLKIVNNKYMPSKDSDFFSDNAIAHSPGILFVSTLDSVIVNSNIQIIDNAYFFTALNFIFTDTVTKYSGALENLTILNNKFYAGGSIKISSKVGVIVKNCIIRNNQFLSLNTNTINIDNSIYFNTGKKSGIKKIYINNCNIYNPQKDVRPRREFGVKLYGTERQDSLIYIQSSGCWWGNSDTSGIFKLDTGVKFKLDDWAIAHWFAVPYGKGSPLTMTNVRADIIRNDSSRYPDNSLKSMEGQFYALGGGYFSPTRVPINPSNVIASDYHFPSGSGAYSVMAVIDADTFRPTKAMLGIQEVGFEQVRVYPIPAQDYLQIEGAALGTQFLLYDISGKLVLNERSNTNPAQLNINTLSSGSYLLKLISPEGKTGTAKVQKE